MLPVFLPPSSLLIYAPKWVHITLRSLCDAQCALRNTYSGTGHFYLALTYLLREHNERRSDAPKPARNQQPLSQTLPTRERPHPLLGATSPDSNNTHKSGRYLMHGQHQADSLADTFKAAVRCDALVVLFTKTPTAFPSIPLGQLLPSRVVLPLFSSRTSPCLHLHHPMCSTASTNAPTSWPTAASATSTATSSSCPSGRAIPPSRSSLPV